jgi:multiple sugar transport system substrate-binding protein/raffinose/stachyose/melibiose transport system substrate-binding protein
MRTALVGILVASLLATAAWLLWPQHRLTAPSPPEAAAGPARVDLYHYWDGSFARLRDELGRQAGDVRGSAVRLVVTPVPHESYKVNAQALLGASTGDELFSWWAGWRTRDLDERGLIAPLDDWWGPAGAERMFSPALVERACTYRGRRCLLPLVQSYVGFFYDARCFREAGLAPPATWEALLAACRSLRGRGVNPIALGTSARWPAQYWFDYLLLRTAGPGYRQRLLDGQAGWTDPEVRAVFARWRELVEAGAFNANPNGSDWLDATKLLHSGGAAMTLMGTWAMDPLLALGWEGGRDFAWFPFPEVVAGVEPATLTVVDGLVLGTGGDDPASVAAVLDRLSSPAVQSALARASGNFAPNLAVGDEAYDPLRRTIRASVGGSRLELPYDLATPPEAERIGLEILTRFLDRPQDAEALLDEAQRRIAERFAERAAVRR